MLAGNTRLHPELGDLSTLCGLADHPFSERSCELVSRLSPTDLGRCYKDVAAVWKRICAESQFDAVKSDVPPAFHLTFPSNDKRKTEIQSMLQVALVEEWLRDAFDSEKPQRNEVCSNSQEHRLESLRALRFHDAMASDPDRTAATAFSKSLTSAASSVPGDPLGLSGQSEHKLERLRFRLNRLPGVSLSVCDRLKLNELRVDRL